MRIVLKRPDKVKKVKTRLDKKADARRARLKAKIKRTTMQIEAK